MKYETYGGTVARVTACGKREIPGQTHGSAFWSANPQLETGRPYHTRNVLSLALASCCGEVTRVLYHCTLTVLLALPAVLLVS